MATDDGRRDDAGSSSDSEEWTMVLCRLFRRDGDPFLPAMVGGVVVPFLVDTGSFGSLVSVGSLRAAGLQHMIDPDHPLFRAYLGQLDHHGLVGGVSLNLMLPHDVKLYENFFVSQDMDILGGSFFHRNMAVLTFMGAFDEMTLLVPPFTPHFDYRLAEMRPYVDCHILGHRTRVLLDSGSNVSILVRDFAYAVPELREALEVADREIMPVEFVGSVTEREVKKVWVGELWAEGQKVWVGWMIVLTPDHLNMTVLGVKELRLNITTVNYFTNIIAFRRYPTRRRHFGRHHYY